MFDALLTVKELKQCKSRVYRKWQTLAIIREISYSNLETGRYGPKSVSISLPDYLGELTVLIAQAKPLFEQSC